MEAVGGSLLECSASGARNLKLKSSDSDSAHNFTPRTGFLVPDFKDLGLKRINAVMKQFIEQNRSKGFSYSKTANNRTPGG